MKKIDKQLFAIYTQLSITNTILINAHKKVLPKNVSNEIQEMLDAIKRVFQE